MPVAPATDPPTPEPVCPNCSNSLEPEHIIGDVYFCQCCGQLFRWRPPSSSGG